MKSDSQEIRETGRTPSMFASRLVLGVMVALILLSVEAKSHKQQWRVKA